MFDPHCTGCDEKVLLGTRRLEGMQNTEHGIVLVFRCHCGAPAMLLTGVEQEPAKV